MTDKAPKGIRITVTDLETGETRTREIWNDYAILTAGTAHVETEADLAAGVHVLTVRGVRRG